MFRNTPRILLSTLLLASAFLFAAPASADSEPVLAPINAFKLPDDFQTFALEDHAAPWVAIDTWVEAGSGADFLGYPGLANALAQALWLSGSRPLHQVISELGGHSEVIVTRDATRFVVNVPAARLSEGLAAVGGALARPEWDALNLSALTSRLEARARAVSEDPAASALERFMVTAFGPELGHGVDGTPDALSGLSVADLKAFHDRHYQPARVKVMLVGDFASGRAVGQLFSGYAAFFKRYAPNTAPPARPLAPAAETRPTRPEAQLVFGVRAGGYENMRELASFDVLTGVLGGEQGRLTSALVGSGLARKVEVSWQPGKGAGALVIHVVAAPGSVMAVEQAVRDQLAMLRSESITLDEQSRAVASALKGFEERNRTLSQRAGTLGAFAVYAGDFRLARQYHLELRQVTRNNLLDLAQKYLTADALKVVVQ